MTSGRRLLVADDDPAVQRALNRLADKHGFQLVSVLRGSSVLETAIAEGPDLIVLDIHFPDADGRDLLSKLKSHERTRAIPVVVWSARDPQSDRRTALELGAEDYVEKRDASTLLSKIERVLLRLRDAG